jgi:hypothetical protein
MTAAWEYRSRDFQREIYAPGTERCAAADNQVKA